MIITLILQLGGILIVFNIKQMIVQHEMKEKLENDSCSFQTLIITSEQYKSAKVNSHEVFLNGKMYDLKSISFIGDSVFLKAIEDIEEIKIMDIIKILSNSMHGANKKLPSQIQNITSLQYIFPIANKAFWVPFFQTEKFHLVLIDFDSIKLEILSPPPRLV